MNYFTPGSTHGFAGDELTERIRRQLRARGRALSFEEAQLEKERGVGKDWQVTKDWIDIIARHAAEYIGGVQDGVRLPNSPPLEIILTGGSGPTIDGLDQAIRLEVIGALRRRGIGPVADQTQIADVVLAEYRLADAITYARRIVSLGAADAEKPNLSHIEKLETARRVETVTWRGSGG